MAAAIDRARALSCFHAPSEIQPLGGGITNLNLRLREGDRRYVVRLGDDIPEHGVMRWNELAISRAAAEAGLAPEVIHAEQGVLVLAYVEGARPLAEADVRDPAYLPRVLDLVARAHRDLGPALKGPVLAFWPFQVIRGYAALLREAGSRHAVALPEMLSAADALAAATGPVEVVIGHNDLLAANILDDGARLWLIDWEYGGLNTPLFDLAGLAGNNGLSEAQERAMLERYFEEPAEARWRPYQAMKCASLMRETLWSMTSEIHSDLDFDYGAYTAENMSRLQAALADFRNL
ncbi:MAG: phosphotransferase [Pseudomonadota bacterium]